MNTPFGRTLTIHKLKCFGSGCSAESVDSPDRNIRAEGGFEGARKLLDSIFPRNDEENKRACATVGNYCPESDCLNQIIHDLHMCKLSTNTKPVAFAGRPCIKSGAGKNVGELPDLGPVACTNDSQFDIHIDRFINACIFLKDASASDSSPCVDCNSSIAHGSVIRSRWRIKLQCLCGLDEHSIFCAKADMLHSFGQKVMHASSSSHKPLSSKNARKDAQNSKLQRVVPLNIDALIPCEEDTLRYDTLPDLGLYIQAVLQRRFFTAAHKKNHQSVACDLVGGNLDTFVQPFMQQFIEGLCVSLLNESMPCLKRAKRTNRSLQVKGEFELTETRACLQVMYGTLLKLFPRGAKRPTFKARVNLAHRLQTMIQKPLEDHITFLQSNVGLVKLCFMEYTINLMKDYMPCEWELVSTKPSMGMYETISTAMFDNFRQEAINTGDEDWESINRVAASCIERCMRICKFKMLRTIEPSNKSFVHGPILFKESAMRMHYMNGDESAMKLMYGRSHTEEEIKFAVTLHNSIRVYCLPWEVTQMQMNSLWELYSSCYMKLHSAQVINFCSTCALAGKGLRSKMRMCSITDKLSCTTCCSGTVVRVNMVGTILNVCGTGYYLCPCCTRLRVWRADGYDMCLIGLHGGAPADICKKYFASEGQCTCMSRSEKEQQLAEESSKSCKCIVCGSRHVNNGKILLPDIEKKVMVKTNLCSKHMPHDHLMKFVQHQHELQALVYQGTTASARCH